MNTKNTFLFPSLLTVALLSVATAALPSDASAQAPKPVRVRANLSGFDIAPKSGKAPNQIGGASRGIGGTSLYAPKMAKAYSLTPTITWSNDDPAAEFTFKLAMEGPGQAPMYEMKVTGGSFTYPADAPALMPGATYVYWVQPTIDMLGGPVTGSILVVGGAEREAIAAALAKASSPDAQAKVFVEKRVWFDALAAYNNLIAQSPKPMYYQARAELYDQLPQTATLADADAAKAH